MEFCTRRELVNQKGHDVHEWPLVIAKDLLDNALDAADSLSPSWPTCAHWYDVSRFRRYMAAHIANRGNITVRK